MPARTIGTELGELIVELNLHPHGTKGLNSMWLIGLHEAGMARFKDRLGGGIEHLITQSPFKHPDNAPYPGSVRCSLRSPAGRVFSSNTGVRLYGFAADALIRISHLGTDQLAQ